MLIRCTCGQMNRIGKDEKEKVYRCGKCHRAFTAEERVRAAFQAILDIAMGKHA